jgi:hypothetical protein
MNRSAHTTLPLGPLPTVAVVEDNRAAIAMQEIS